MQKRKAKVTAGSYALIPISGKQWKLGTVSDKSAIVNVEWYNAVGATLATWEAIERRATYKPPEGFGSFKITSDKDVYVDYYVTDGDGDFDVDVDINGQEVKVFNDPDKPLFVATPPNTSLNVNVVNDCDNPVHIEICAVKYGKHICEQVDIKTLADGGTQIVTAGEGLKRLMVRNTGEENIILEPSAATGNGVILLRPDEWWSETDNPDWDWFVYSDTSTVTIFIEKLIK